MGKPAARLGDPTAHGGVVVLGFPMVIIGGMPAARIGDMHVCPMMTPGVPPIPHVGGPVMLGSPMVMIGGMPAARMGDMATCAGPPDTIMMGCPTVLIGEGGSGSGSGGGASGGAGVGASAKGSTANVIDIAEDVLRAMAGVGNPATGLINAGLTAADSVACAIASVASALSENNESSTKEGHWLEYEFVDTAGNPVSGIEYELTHPDQKQSGGTLQSDGKVRRDVQDSGNAKVILKNLSNAKWSKEIAKVGEKIKLSAETDGIKDGTSIKILIYRKDINGSDKFVKTLEEKVKNGKIETEIDNNFEQKETESDNSQAMFSSSGYYFEAMTDTLKSRSDLLFIEDFLEIELKDRDRNPLANEEFILYLPNGKIQTGKLDSGGHKKIEKVPAGRYSIKFPSLIKKQKK